MKKFFTIIFILFVTSFAKSQCVPPATIAVGPYYIPCGPFSVVISAGTSSSTPTYSYSWASPPFAAMSCPSGTSCSSNYVNGAGVYTVTIFDTTVPGCFSTNTMSVIQGTNLSLYLSGNDTICSGSTAFISASPFPTSPSPSYTWSTGSNLSSISVTPTVTSIYTVSAYNSAYGCSGTSSFTVNVIVCSGINELIWKGSVTLAPNPNNGKFNVVVNAYIENAEIKIVNAIGQEVHHQNIKQGVNEINAGVLARGIYNYSVYQNKELVKRGKILIE